MYFHPYLHPLPHSPSPLPPSHSHSPVRLRMISTSLILNSLKGCLWWSSDKTRPQRNWSLKSLTLSLLVPPQRLAPPLHTVYTHPHSLHCTITHIRARFHHSFSYFHTHAHMRTYMYMYTYMHVHIHMRVCNAHTHTFTLTTCTCISHTHFHSLVHAHFHSHIHLYINDYVQSCTMYVHTFLCTHTDRL